MPKHIIFAGAPRSADLRQKSNKLLSTFSPQIASFSGLELDKSGSFHPSPTQLSVAWYSLRPVNRDLANPYPVPASLEEYQGNAAYFAAEDPSFLSTEVEGETSIHETQEDVVSQFYNHSLAIHENAPSSQIHASASISSTSEDDSTSLNTTSTTDQSHSTNSLLLESFTSTTATNLVPQIGPITNLRNLPNATYLQSIEPQTMTVNLVCGIISISPPRSIQTRHGKTVQLIEMLVGDETKSAFPVNFWLPQLIAGKTSELRESLDGLRPRDIVLLKHVALSYFKGKVYGQSLRGEMTKSSLLLRKRLDKTDRPGIFTIKRLRGDVSTEFEKKTKRVWEWVLAFVGGGSDSPAWAGGKRKRIDEGMPPDTQL